MGEASERAGDEEGYGARRDPAPGAAPATPGGPPADAGEAWSIRNPEEQANHDQDPEYGSWRDAQMADFDRDYAEYQRQHPSGLKADFAAWREKRGRDRR
jgi:hypothetical protein